MSIAHPSQLLSFLEQIGASPLKKLSQNFLINQPILETIVNSMDITPSESIFEIGPGPGALTELLLQRKANVWAIEKDRLFAKSLHRFQTPCDSLHVIHQDFLKFSLLKFLEEHGPMKVIGNLPYHITTPIIETLCYCKQYISSAVLMVQEEMKDRLLASPGTKSIGSFSIFLQAHAKISSIANVSKKCFYPAPSVNSAVIKLDFYNSKPPSADFFSLVRQGFQKRRKMLRRSLGLDFANKYATHRPEQLSLEDWHELYLLVSK